MGIKGDLSFSFTNHVHQNKPLPNMPVTDAGKKYNCQLVLAQIEGEDKKGSDLYASIDSYDAQADISDSREELMKDEHFKHLAELIATDIFQRQMKGKSVANWFSQLKKDERKKVNEAKRAVKDILSTL